MADPREYDREYTTTVGTTVRRRTGLTTHEGDVIRFVVQLEYDREDDWKIIVRYDHDAEASTEMSHDVTEDGLHMDIYRDGKKYDTEFVAPPMPAGAALDFAEDHLAENLERFIRRFEEWHGIRSQ